MSKKKDKFVFNEVSSLVKGSYLDWRDQRSGEHMAALAKKISIFQIWVAHPW